MKLSSWWCLVTAALAKPYGYPEVTLRQSTALRQVPQQKYKQRDTELLESDQRAKAKGDEGVREP